MLYSILLRAGIYYIKHVGIYKALVHVRPHLCRICHPSMVTLLILVKTDIKILEKVLFAPCARYYLSYEEMPDLYILYIQNDGCFDIALFFPQLIHFL